VVERDIRQRPLHPGGVAMERVIGSTRRLLAEGREERCCMSVPRRVAEFLSGQFDVGPRECEFDVQATRLLIENHPRRDLANGKL
jgi:hypothetical protein